MIVAIRLPVAGKDSGIGLSIDGGTTYHPLTYGTTNRLTTHFSTGSAILLMYDASSSCSVYGTSAGATSTSATSIKGIWRVLNLWTDGNTYTSAYCNTAATTAAKQAQCSSYVISDKHYLHVTIANTNTAASALTFNVNWQGAKPIYINGAASSVTNHNLPRGTYLVYYDGTNYQFRTDGIIPGAISTATALSSSAGSATVPVYFSNGKPVAITSYSGNASTATKAAQDESGNNIKSSYASALSISDRTIALKNKNGVSLSTITIPWRGVQNNLTSTSTTDALAAAQGKILNEKIAHKADYDDGPEGVTIGSTKKFLKICTIEQVAIGFSDLQLSFVISSRYCRTERICFLCTISNKKSITSTSLYYEGPNGNIFKVCAYQKIATETDIGDSIEIWCEVSAWNHMEIRRKECCTNTDNLIISWNMELADTLPVETAGSIEKIEPLSTHRQLQINGKTYNGSSTVNVGIIGAAYGGSGKSTLFESANVYLNALGTAAAIPQDDDYYISQYAGGGITTTTYHRRPVKALYAYMKAKTDDIYAAKSHTHTWSQISDGTTASINTSGSITAKGGFVGNASTANAFNSSRTITLTGNVTGSASSTGASGWSVATIIASGAVTNAMLAGSIANSKLANSAVTIAGNSVSLGSSVSAETLRTSLGLSNAMHFIGIATVDITDGSTTDPKIANYSTKAKGDVIIDKHSSYEYVWTGSTWEKLGGDASYKTTQSAVGDPAASGNSSTFIKTISQNANGVITATKATIATLTLQGNGTAAGSYSGGSAVTVNFKPGAGISVTGAAGTITIAHSNSITAKTAYGSTAITASANGGKIIVTDVKYDAHGHITSSTDRTITLSQTTYTLAGLMGSTAKGSTTQPVYWTGTTWANTTYTLGASVPSDAKFTDTVYTLPTASSTLGGVKTTSTVTEVGDYTACPIISGVPYYRNVVQDNLNSKSTTDSLSANQGRLLNASKVRRQSWETPIAANKWSRICYVLKKNWVIGSSYMINIAINGGGIVCNDLFVIKTHATSKAQITKISGSNTSTYKIRVVSNDDGDSYVELFIQASDQVTAQCIFIDMAAGSLTPYWALTDGSTLPANFAANATLTTNNNSLQGNLTWEEISNHATCTINTSGTITGSKVYGAVWNDYAEFRCAVEEVAAGDVVWSDDKGNLHKTFERMQPFEGVVSDTYGFAIGETDRAKTPLAVAGRVLVRTDCDRNSFHAGDVVCTGENGTVSKMTRNEVVMYPDRIVGTVSEIPDYDIWGSGNIAVKNRIWIKVK